MNAPRLRAHEVRVKEALDAVRDRCDVASRLSADPVAFVHRFEDPLDRELVALVAACVAFGNVKTVRAKLQELLDRLGPNPARLAQDPGALGIALKGWKHRLFQGGDIACLLVGAREVQRASGSLGARFEAELAMARRSVARGEPGSEGLTDYAIVREALAAWSDAIRAAGGLRRGRRRRGPAHLLPDVRAGSGNKRLLLLLRWMVRPSDGVDLGAWKVDPACLLMPVDVHIHKLARNLGFTRRRGMSWRTTEEITRALARLAPADPTRYDFSLCHMGMLQRCPSRRDASRCEGCGVKPVCIHWSPRHQQSR
jgi:uncharacterized protein (TIGR02757 family)